MGVNANRKSKELVTVFDGYKLVGTMQICVSRMLQESGIFFAVSSTILVRFKL
jgi:hypothetical protein